MNNKTTLNNSHSDKKTQSEKKLLTMLMEQAEQADSCQGGGINLALFLANKEDISEAINAGWNSKSIWRVLREHKKFNGSYECFRRYVKQHILESQVRQNQQEPASRQTFASRPIVGKQNGKVATKFEFSATPNENELI